MTSSKAGRYKITAQLTMGKAPKSGEPPHAELANVAGDAASTWAFFDRWGPLHAENLTSPEQAERLRAAGVECPFISSEQRDHLRKAWEGDSNSLDYIRLSAGQYMKFDWRFNDRDIELVPHDLWSTVCLLFLRDQAANRIAICENPDCYSPYFVKRRSSQKFCDAGACTQFAQRKYARDWWGAHGEQQRQERRKEAQQKSKRRAK